MELVEPEITRDLLIRARRLALRNGRWFRLHPAERAVLTLSCRVLTRVRSATLKQVILKILEKISERLLLAWRVVSIGYEVARRRAEQAVKLGYYKALDWLRDFGYIWYLGWSYISEPLTYGSAC